MTGKQECVPAAVFPDLAGQVAVITGADGGIGMGIAEVLAGQKMKLVLTDRRFERAEPLIERLTAAGVELHWVQADLATPEGAAEVFEQAIETFGRIDLLVNNAAVKGGRSILKLEEKFYQSTLERNMRLMYQLSYLVSKHMAEVGGGNIINISSVGGLRAHKAQAGYDASKGACDALTRAMAVDLGGYGVRVNGIAPGVTDSVPDGYWQTPHRAGRREELEASVPLGRLGECKDIGYAAAFLASAAGAYITGQIIYVDGGITAQLAPPGKQI